MRQIFIAAGLACLLAADHTFAQQPLKVFVLAGQSNMQGHAEVRTLEHLAMNEATLPLLRLVCNEDQSPRVFDQVWISYLSDDGVQQGNLTTGFGANKNKLGPELAFGARMHELLDGPILIIKTAWGGKSLNTDFRPPNAGAYEFDEHVLKRWKEQSKDVETILADKREATGLSYRAMINHVQEVRRDISRVVPNYDFKQGHEVAGFVWFQGWNDLVDSDTYPQRDLPDGYFQYSVVLEHLIRDVRQDLATPDLPFVIGVLGVGGPVANFGSEQQRYEKIHQNFRDAMSAPANRPEFRGTVVNVLTEIYWDSELTELLSREERVKQKSIDLTREQQLDENSARELLEQLRRNEFTERELETLAKAVSNQEYHYLGSAKILCQIGRAFADAMYELQK